MATIRLTTKEIRLSFDRLLIDARNDFWPDPFRYVDLRLEKEAIVSSISKELNSLFSSSSQNIKTYTIFHWDVPKSNHVVRHAALLHPHDILIYHIILNRLVRLIEPKLEKSRYSYRISDPNDKYLFGKKGVDNWLSFKNDIIQLFKNSKKYEYLVSTDIAGFFEYMHLQDFKKQLENLTQNRLKPIIELLNSFLKKVAMSRHSGIPQNYDPSSYLCSAFLDFLDKDLSAKGIKHFRYVDDIKIACKNEKEAKLSIIHVIHSLRNMNLNVQSSKTEIWHKNSKEYKYFSKDFPILLTKIDDAIQKKNKLAIELILTKLIIFTKKEMTRPTFDDRLFRACIWRIKKCFYFKNVSHPSMNSINNKCIKLIQDIPGRTDSFTDYLSLSKDSKRIQSQIFEIIKKSVYAWQQVKLWELLIKANKVKIESSLQYARRKLTNRLEHSPVINMLLLFLGKHGNYNDKQYISRMFEQPHSIYTKRCILIAIQEHSDRKIIYDKVISGDDVYLRSIVRYILNLKKPLYIYEDKKIGSDLAEVS